MNIMQPITQNKKRIKVQHIVGNGTAQVDIVRNIQLPARARKIVDIHAEIVELDYEIIPNKIIVKGALHKQIYYVEVQNRMLSYHTDEGVFTMRGTMQSVEQMLVLLRLR